MLTWRALQGTLTGLAIIAGTVAFSGCGRKPQPTSSVSGAPSAAATDSAALGASATAGGSGGRGETMPVIVSGGRAADSAALAPLNLTFGAIGYRNGITLLGTSAAAVIAIPVNDGLRPSEFRLHVLTTPRMPAATMVLKQRDHIIALRGVTDTSTVVTFPLANAVIENGKATFEIGLTVPGPDLCQAARFFHTVLTPESQVIFAGTPRPTAEANGFFQPWVDHVTFYLSDQPSLDASQAALDASAYVARRYRGMATTFDIQPLPAAGTPLPEPGPWSRAIVFAPSGNSTVVHIDNGRGTVLAIASRRDARQLFTLAVGSDIVAASGFKSTAIDLAHDIPASGPIRTFADLGIESRTIEGSSLVASSYELTLADFGTTVTPTSLRLIVRHSTLPPNGNGSMRLHLNGDLIYSRALDHDGFDVVIPIPAHLLRRDNVFDVRFQVTLGEGACLIGGPVFTATIDDNSAFITNGTTTLPPGFSRFPQAFIPAFSVLLEPMDRYRVQLAATVIGAMQQTTRTPLAPSVARDRASATGPLLAVGTNSLAEALDAPLKSDGVRLRDRAGKVWDEFAPDAPYGAMQGFQHNGNDVLLLHHTGANGQPLADLLRETLQPYGWFGVRGDLTIRGLQGPARSITATNAGWRLEQEPATPENLFIRYKTPIFVVAAILVVLLLIWLYPRVVRRELDTTG